MYKAAGPAPGSGTATGGDGAAGAQPGGEKKENVVDAEFVDMDDQKK